MIGSDPVDRDRRYGISLRVYRDVRKSMLGDLQVMMMGWFREMMWGVGEVSCDPRCRTGFGLEVRVDGCL
jgi:hypothetical protein